MNCICIIVSGKVQGVYYRASAKARALELGLKGFARNESNGDVYIEAEGPDASLDAFIKWCSIGPPRAFVESIRREAIERKGFVGFEIK